jgi:hypothetical protein
MVIMQCILKGLVPFVFLENTMPMRCGTCSLTPVVAIVGLAGLAFAGFNYLKGGCCAGDAAPVAKLTTVGTASERTIPLVPAMETAHNPGTGDDGCCSAKAASCCDEEGCGGSCSGGCDDAEPATP